MQLIAKQTVGAGGAASVTFSSIPQTFTDLKVVMSTRSSGTSVVQIQFNGSTSNRSNIRLYGNGSVTASFSGSDVFTYQNRSSYTANTFDSSEIYIPNYTSSNFKSVSIDNVTETNASAVDMQLQAGLWSQTAAITSLGFFPDSSQTFVEFSEFTLYGISNSTTTQNPTTPSAIGGDIINTDGTYWYHTFLYSGTFTPLKNLTCDYLVVAGGGGAGRDYSAGAGAGGYRTSIGGTALSLIANTAYVSQIGSGGAGGASSGAPGTKGGNSIFSTITSTGGAFSRTLNNVGEAGGSGSGGSRSSAGTNAGGAGNEGGYSPVEGYAGGSGTLGTGGSGNNDFPTGGGGGAGAVGGNGSGSQSGAGGVGLSNSISGTATFYAGGGGGGGYNGPGSQPTLAGAGGNGGGGAGNGGSGGAGGNGTVNRGGGGGGASGANGNGGNGGSGIVIVRYAV